MSQHSHTLPRGDSLLVAEYVCGLLKPEERAHVHVLLSRNDEALAQALAWEEDLLSLVDALPPVRPSPALQQRLQRTLGIQPAPAFQPPPQPQLLRKPSRDAAGPSPATAQPVPHAIPEGVPAPGPSTPAGSDPTPPAAATRLPEADWDHQAAGLRPAVEHSHLNGRRANAGDQATAQATQPPVAEPTPPIPAASSKAITADVAPASSSPGPGLAAPPAATSGLAATSRPSPESAAESLAPKESSTGKPNPASPTHALQRRLWLWQLIGVCATVAAVVAFILPGEPPPPPVQVVKVAPTRAAILQAPGTTSTPGWTATLGPEGNLMMQPLVRTEVPTGSQALLWTRSEQIPEPRLLGRIDPNQPVQVPAHQLGALADDQLLEITLETDEDAAKGVPNGPVLFIGQMTVFGTEGSVATSGGTAPSATDSPAAQRVPGQ